MASAFTRLQTVMYARVGESVSENESQPGTSVTLRDSARLQANPVKTPGIRRVLIMAATVRSANYTRGEVSPSRAKRAWTWCPHIECASLCLWRIQARKPCAVGYMVAT